MTVAKKQILPALHNSGKVQDPDLPEIGDKNYTATILKYTNLALQFPQLDTNAKTIVGAVNEIYQGGGGGGTTSIHSITQEQWDQLTPEEQAKNDYVVTDPNTIPLTASLIPYDAELSVKQKIDDIDIEPNPSAGATKKLTRLRIGDTVYSISLNPNVHFSLRDTAAPIPLGNFEIASAEDSCSVSLTT